MIRVYAQRRGNKYRLLVSGHADATPAGRQLCAAVSALTGALVAFAEKREDCSPVRSSLGAGRAFLSCCGALSEAFELVTDALAALALQHPENMQYAPCAVDDKLPRAML